MPHLLNMLHARLLAVFAAIMLLVVGCDSFEGEKILGHNEPDTAAEVEVRSQMHGGKTRVHMQVTRKGSTKRLVLVDGVQLKNASLVRYNEWLLVLAGNYVLGGYNIDSDKIVAMNSDALPFTVRDRSGYVVDSRTLGEGEDVPPINFRERADPRT